MSLTLFPTRPNSHPYSPYPKSPGESLSPRSSLSVWPPAMYRPPPPRVNTRSELPRDPSNWLDRDLLTYVNSHYSASESSSAVELIRDNRLTPRALWYLQADHDAFSSLTTEESLRQFLISLAQSVQPAVSPTTPRVKHIRRLSEDFAHPPPPPTPPPPSPTLPEESESEEDDDVAESVISDWALDGDNDEIHEAAEAPPADATRAEATPEPAGIQHVEPAPGENTLGLDIGGEPSQPSEPSEPVEHPPEPQPALSTTSAEESLIDFEDAPEIASRAPSEPPSGDAAGTQPAETDTAQEPSADPQVTGDAALAQPEDAEGVAPLVNVPEATEELPSDASKRADPPAGEHASENTASGAMPGMFGIDDDLGDPWAQHDETETTTEPPTLEETAAPEIGGPGQGADVEVETVEIQRATETEATHELTQPANPVSPTSDPPCGDAAELSPGATQGGADPDAHHQTLPSQGEHEYLPSRAKSPSPEAEAGRDEASSQPAAAETSTNLTETPAHGSSAGGESDERLPVTDSTELNGPLDSRETPQDDPSASTPLPTIILPAGDETPVPEEALTAPQETSTMPPPEPSSATPAETETRPAQASPIVSGEGHSTRPPDDQHHVSQSSEDVEVNTKLEIVLSAAPYADQLDACAESLPVTPSVEGPATTQADGDASETVDKEARKKAKKARQAAEKAEKAAAKAKAEADAKAKVEAEARAGVGRGKPTVERKTEREAPQTAPGASSSKKGKGRRQRQKSGKTETEVESPTVETGQGADEQHAPEEDKAGEGEPDAETNTQHVSTEQSESQAQTFSSSPPHATTPEQSREDVDVGQVQSSAQPHDALKQAQSPSDEPTNDAPPSPTVTLANGDEMLVVVRDAEEQHSEEKALPPVLGSSGEESSTHLDPQPLATSTPSAIRTSKLLGHSAPDPTHTPPMPAPGPHEGLRVNTAFPALTDQRRMRGPMSSNPVHTPSSPMSSVLGWGSANPTKSRTGGFLSSVANFATSFISESGSSSRNSSQEREFTHVPSKTPLSTRLLSTSVWDAEKQRLPAAVPDVIAQPHASNPDPNPASSSHGATVLPQSSGDATTGSSIVPTGSSDPGEKAIEDGVADAISESCLVVQGDSASAQQPSDTRSPGAGDSQSTGNEPRNLANMNPFISESAGRPSADKDGDGDEEDNEPLSNWVQVVKDRQAAIAARSDEESDAEDSAVERHASSPRRGKKAHLPLRVHELAGSDGDQSSPSTPTTTDAYGNETNDPDSTVASPSGTASLTKRQRRKANKKSRGST